MVRYILTAIGCLLAALAQAQDIRISGNVYSDIDGPVMMANVVEKDANNRIVSAAVTDFDGNFSMTISNKNNKLTVSYVGYKTAVVPIGDKTVFKIKLEDATQIQEVVVTATKKYRGGGLAIPESEVSQAKQSINMSEVEGLAFTSADEALQGKIAGLDIISTSGNLGSGTQMRLRGVSTISGNSSPLIVVDDNIMDNPDESFDFTNANEESYAALLSINPQDIESIDVLKDAAATAIWGSRGANGVISIHTKRGARGNIKVDYNFRLSANWQPKGYNLLNGDDYTMMMKEEIYNPTQTATATTGIKELNYDTSWAEYQNWNNNTDWVKAVTKVGWSQSHFFTLSGGGEKANFRVSAGYDRQTGTIIKQQLDRFSTKLVLDYFVSDRIKFSTSFPLTYTYNQHNYDDNILGRAQKTAPNMSIYRKDGNGNDTDEYYIMLPSGDATNSGYSSSQLSQIRSLGNPVAIANLAWRNEKTYRITPEFKIDYDLLGKDPDKTQLKYTGSVYLDVFSKSEPKYWPGKLSTDDWQSNSYNESTVYDYNSLAYTIRNTLTFTPHFRNKDLFSTMLLRWEMVSGESNSQSITSKYLPNEVTSPTVDANLNSMSTANSQWRSLSGIYTGHISYKGRYSLDLSLRADGSTKFGDKNKWGFFPGVSARWNISDEKFMQGTKSWLSMLAFRPSYGVVGNQPGAEYLYFSKYVTSGVYGGGSNNYAVAYLDGMKLSNLKWERTAQYNLGANLGLFNDLITADFNYYYKKTTDLLMSGVNIPSSSGFAKLSYSNVGDMENKGWELNIQANKFIKVGKFSMSANFNISQNFNKLLSMDNSVLESLNTDWTTSYLGSYLQNIRTGNAIGSIYGLKYKGVYNYSYSYIINYPKNHAAEVEAAGGYESWLNNFIRQEGHNVPVATDENGNVLMYEGTPVRKVLAFNSDTNSSTYEFDGGDAIYEDVNHDGQIDKYDVVYLGNSNPKFNGGFGLDFYYGNWSFKTSFTFRTGFKVVNLARMNLENMYYAYNQSSAVNWRWRTNGDYFDSDVLPRAMYNSAYNWYGSDRYVEDASFLRFSYFQLGYKFDTKVLKKYGLSRLQIYLSGQNMFVWSKYSGTDPEVSASAWGIAYDNSQTPRSKSFTLNINVGF